MLSKEAIEELSDRMFNVLFMCTEKSLRSIFFPKLSSMTQEKENSRRFRQVQIPPQP